MMLTLPVLSLQCGLDIVLPVLALLISMVCVGYILIFNTGDRCTRFEEVLVNEPNASSMHMRFDFDTVLRDFNKHIQVEVYPVTVWDKFLPIAEFTILISQMTLSILLFKSLTPKLVIQFITILYLIVIYVLRVVYSGITELSQWKHFNLFKNSVFIYHINVIFDVIQIFELDSTHSLPVILNIALLSITYFLRFQNGHVASFCQGDAQPCLEPISSLFSTLTFSWTNALLKQASIKPLTAIDIWGLAKDDYAVNIVVRFQRYFHNPETKLVLRLLKYFRQLFLTQLFCGIISSIMTFLPSILLKQFLDYVAHPMDTRSNNAWYMVFLMFFLKNFESIFGSFSLYIGKRIDIRLRTLLINEIYCKLLKKSLTSSQSAGAIMNLMSADSYNIGSTIGYMITIPISIFMIIIAVALLFQILGWSAFIGSAVIIILIPLNHRSASKMGSYQKKVLKKADHRISQLNEIFNNIKAIKSFTWEDKFYQDVMHTRDSEIHNLKKKTLYTSFQSLLTSATPTLVTFGAFFFYTIIQGKELTTSILFTSLTLFNLLRQPLIDLAAWLSDLYQAWISLQRIQAFLDDSETGKYQVLDKSVSGKIGFKDLSFAWGQGFKLDKISVEFQPGLNIIISATGSGKTSLLLALLGEMQLTNNGEVFLPGRIPRYLLNKSAKSGFKDSVAYCSQMAWLINDTIKNNIIFHSPIDESRYEAVLKACALDEDLKLISDGTEIGEKGVVLSGGQRQRLALARAMYSTAEYILLDDCLSAVDTHTALWIYDNCLTGDLMKGRTCVMTSHNVSLTVTKANWVVMLDGGKVILQGTSKELILKGNLVVDKKIRSSDEDEVAEVKDTPIVKPKDNKLIEDETKNEGAILSSIYMDYFKLIGGVPVWIIIIGLYIITELLFVSQSLWLRTWTSGDSNQHSGLYYINIYLLIGGLFSILTTIRVYYVSMRGFKASNAIFSNAFSCILKATSRFFDITPKGRIINRFAKDIQSIDQELIRYTEVTLMYLTHCFCTIVMICLITPMFLLFVGFILLIYYLLGKKYLALSRELKRIDSITRSPIYSQFQETLNGLVTIRAYGDELRYVKQNLSKLDQNNKAYYYLWISNRWLSVRTDFIGALILLLAGSFIILNVQNLDAGLAGLSLTYAMTFNSYAVWLIRAYVTVEMSMNSVERLEEYATLEQEARSDLPLDSLIDLNWPRNGNMEVKNLTLKYDKKLEPVLRSVSFNVESLQKVAIVGRTGAGKSTFISACFRFLEPEIGSKICIDGVDIQQIGLQKLRSSICMIPQDPALFKGSIRSNLDPFHEHSDTLILKALNDVSIASSMEQLVEENGSNFSQGEKQLLCLARLLLKNSKVVFLDEATSSIDHHTDDLIQLTVRKSFLQSSVITIAHRLNSIIDYDKVLVLDKGQLTEFDTPELLLQNPKSLFYKLCERSGDLSTLMQKVKH